MTDKQIAAEAMVRLSAHKYFYQKMIVCCVESIFHQRGLERDPERESRIVEMVNNGFVVCQLEKMLGFC